MGDRTGIQWTEATWNPITGCTEVSPGCDNCYAARIARGRMRKRYLEGGLLAQDQDPDDPFSVRLWPDRLDQPLRWKKPRMIFVNSMSDLFHRAVPDKFIGHIFGIMQGAPHHTYQILTKRPARAAEWVNRNTGLLEWPPGMNSPRLPPQIWIGTSIERSQELYRLRHLQAVPATVRFISFEPLLEEIDLTPMQLAGIHWAIVGGESGPPLRVRRMDPNWSLKIRAACEHVGVAFFMKQMGSVWAADNGAGNPHGGALEEWLPYLQVRQWPHSRT